VVQVRGHARQLMLQAEAAHAAGVAGVAGSRGTHGPAQLRGVAGGEQHDAHRGRAAATPAQ
jgi:hypothetical protein